MTVFSTLGEYSFVLHMHGCVIAYQSGSCNSIVLVRCHLVLAVSTFQMTCVSFLNLWHVFFCSIRVLLYICLLWLVLAGLLSNSSLVCFSPSGLDFDIGDVLLVVGCLERGSLALAVVDVSAFPVGSIGAFPRSEYPKMRSGKRRRRMELEKRVGKDV